jgi:hypothetical protein
MSHLPGFTTFGCLSFNWLTFCHDKNFALFLASTTQIYAKVTDDKIDMDTRSLEEKIAGRFSVAI